jgi:GrpB-like predicted nucleotidyltransferase (UPF0157 family)
MVRKVEVVPYRDEWPEQFEAEAESLRQIFGKHVVAIFHFGSTAIPGVSAKPIIDILMTVDDIKTADEFSAKLAALGYVAVGEYGITGRRFFFKGSNDSRSHHLHIYGHDNPHVLRHIAFRDFLRTHPVTARRYAQLKEQLAHEFPEDMDGYISGKNDFVKEQERKALRWWERNHKDS